MRRGDPRDCLPCRPSRLFGVLELITVDLFPRFLPLNIQKSAEILRAKCFWARIRFIQHAYSNVKSLS
jgi:hypothetical protein